MLMNFDQYTFRKPSELKPHPQNDAIYNQDPIASKEQLDRLIETIKATKYIAPVTINKDDVIIKGHNRCLAAAILEMDVPVVVEEYDSEKDELLALLSDNFHRIQTIEQRIRSAKLWGEIETKPKGIKTREWLAKKAGFSSGTTFSDAEMCIDFIDQCLVQSNFCMANLVRFHLNKSVLAGKKIVKQIESGLNLEWIYRYDGGDPIHDMSGRELLPGDEVYIVPETNGVKFDTLQVAPFSNRGHFSIPFSHLEIELICHENPIDLWLHPIALSLHSCDSPTKQRFFKRWDFCTISQKFDFLKSRQNILNELIKSIASQEPTFEDDFKNQQQVIAQLKHEQHVLNLMEEQLKDHAELAKETMSQSSKPSSNEDFEEGDEVIDRLDNRKGTISKISSHKIGKPDDQSEVLDIEVAWEDGETTKNPPEFIEKIKPGAKSKKSKEEDYSRIDEAIELLKGLIKPKQLTPVFENWSESELNEAMEIIEEMLTKG